VIVNRVHARFESIERLEPLEQLERLELFHNPEEKEWR
jgi:hypothetical protein